MTYNEYDPNEDNNLVVTGALMMLLRPGAGGLTEVDVVTDAQGQPTNQFDIKLSFMASTYRVTVMRLEP